MSITRKNRLKYFSLAGKFASKKTGKLHFFESSLERDFILLLEADPVVLDYIEQPLSIQYSPTDKRFKYTPDFLVTFDHPLLKRNILYEIKYLSELNKKEDDFFSKFSAAKEYANEKGWDFEVLTENEIRTPYLENARFLLNYRDYEYENIEDFELLLQTIIDLDETTPEEAILIAAWDKNKQAELIYLLWHMISVGYIKCDLNKKVTMQSEIWVNQM